MGQALIISLRLRGISNRNGEKMISLFGVISVVIALISVAVIMLHNQVMRKRTPVDTYIDALEALLRKRVEALYHASHPDSELHALCAECVDLDFDSIVKALPDIDRAFAEEAEYLNLDESEWNESQPPTMDIDATDLSKNTQAIQETTEALNQAIEVYNSFITGRLPVVLMALTLGLTTEEYY